MPEEKLAQGPGCGCVISFNNSSGAPLKRRSGGFFYYKKYNQFTGA